MMCEIFKDEEGLSRVRWHCPLCDHRWDFHVSGVEDIGFFIVHHLVGKHRLRTDELVAYDAGLAESIREYLGSDTSASPSYEAVAPSKE